MSPPEPPPDDAVYTYADYAAFADAAEALAWTRERERAHPALYDARRYIADRLGHLVGRRARLLDVGGGAALQGEVVLARLADAAYVWIDPSAAMRALAEARLAHRSACWFRTGPLLPELAALDAAATFDAAWAVDAFGARGLTGAPEAVHEAVRARLAPGGRYFVCEPYAGAPGVPEDAGHATVDAQRAALAAAGFEVAASLTLVGDLAVHEVVRAE